MENRKALPTEVKRWTAYWMLIEYCTSYYFTGLRDLPDIDGFLTSIHHSLGNYPGEGKENELSFRTCFQVPKETPDWVSLERLFFEQGLAELAALAAFRLMPNAEHIGNLLEAMEYLPAGQRRLFLFVLREQDWLLREVSEALEKGESTEKLQRRYDDEIIRHYREREATIILALKEQNYATLSAINAWKELEIKTLDPEDRGFPAFFERICNETIQTCGIRHNNSLPETSRTAFLRRFSMCFNDWSRIVFALQAFAETPASILASDRITYPSGLPQFTVGALGQYHSSAILERLEVLCKLGDSYTDAYALVPYALDNVETKDLRCLVGYAASHYEVVKAGGNDCALLGVILLLLMGEVPDDLYRPLCEELERLLAAGITPSRWHQFSRHLSLKGKLLAHEAGIAAFKGTDKEKAFLRLSQSEILRSLEALPAERDKLPNCITASNV